jgi:hypothetical protein
MIALNVRFTGERTVYAVNELSLTLGDSDRRAVMRHEGKSQRGLLASTVHGAKRGERLRTIPGTPPSHNCSFAPRCTLAQPRCTETLPPQVGLGPARMARCVLSGARSCCRDVTVRINQGHRSGSESSGCPALSRFKRPPGDAPVWANRPFRLG